MTIEQFGQQIKEKYPQYKDVSDNELGQKMLTKYPTYQKLIDQGNKKTIDIFLSGHPVLRGISDFLGTTGLAKGATQAIFLNFTSEGKDVQKLLQEGKINPDQFDEIIGGGLATPKEIAGGALGTATAITGFSGLPSVLTKSIAGRIAGGTILGAGFGASSALQKEGNIKEIAKETAIGGAIGFGTSALLEGISAGLRKISQSKFVQKRTGYTYNKELQPPVKEISKDIEKGFKTFGETVADVKDASGKPVYVGTYSTILSKAKNEISTHGAELESRLKDFTVQNPDIIITRQEVAKGILKQMQDIYGRLNDSQVKKIEFEITRIPLKMNVVKLEKTKRLFDGLIPENFWSKVDDPAISFPSLAKYILRDNARKLINETTNDPIIQALNNRMSIAFDVRGLAATQIAKRTLAKVSEAGGTGTTRFPISYYISKFFDDILFNPAITTRASQSIRKLGTKVASTPARVIGRTATIRAIEQGLNQ